MDYQNLAVISGFVFLYALLATRLQRTRVNGALVYVAIGFLCSNNVFGWIDIHIGSEGLKGLAELALALVLFTDSANTNLSTLRRFETLPIRLLLIGLPLTIALGIGVAYLVFGQLAFFEIALLATMLAPTDAALGKPVVTNPQVPDSIRESLNVESGLNDGICVPVLLFFLALAVGDTESGQEAELMARLTLEAIGIGLLVGLLGGSFGSRLVTFFAGRHWVTGTWLQLPVIALALFCFATAQGMGGSGFIACFVGGLLFGGMAKRDKQQFLDAAEGIGDALALVTWFVFGAAVIGLTWHDLNWQVFTYALLSLTVVRMLPVFMSLLGTSLKMETKLFLGWFGPRGLASIVFVVLVQDQALPGNRTLVATVTWTILLSVLLHGLSANPLARIYGQRIEQAGGEI